MSDFPCTPDQTAVRLRAILRVLGGTKTAFGQLLGVTPNRVHQLLMGEYMPRPDALWQLYLKRNIPPHFVLFGLPKELPDTLRDGVIDALESCRREFDEETASASPKGQSRGTL